MTRRRTSSWVDAEDATQEAIVRALEAPDLDLEQLPGWLTRVALNLCTDVGRDQRRHHKRVRYQVMQQAAEPDAEAVVLDRAYAQSVYDLALALPPAQRAAVLLKAEGLSVGEVAAVLDVSTKAAESLLSRARTALRRAAGAFLTGAAVLVRHVRRSAPQLAATTTVSAALILTPLLGGAAGHRVVPLSPGTTRDAVGSRIAAATPTQPHQSAATQGNRPVRGSEGRHASAQRTLVAPRDTAVGPARIHDNGEGWRHPGESLIKSVQECLEQGVVVSTQYVGCTAGQRIQPGIG